jgi:hypothetical protein
MVDYLDGRERSLFVGRSEMIPSYIDKIQDIHIRHHGVLAVLLWEWRLPGLLEPFSNYHEQDQDHPYHREEKR